RSADEALDLLRSAALLAACGLARRARVGRAGQHPVFRGDPTLILAAQERGHGVLDAGGTQHLRIADFDQYSALGVLGEPARESDRAHLFGRASARACHDNQRKAAAEVLSLAAPVRVTALSPSSSSFSRSGTPVAPPLRGAESSAAISASFRPLHKPSVHSISTSP